MDWLKKNPEKVVLILVAVLALGFGAKHLLTVQGYAETFELSGPTKKGKAIPETEEGKVKTSATLVESELRWKDQEIVIPGSNQPKKVPLLCSVYIVEKAGKLFDLANPKTEALRPPIENTWIRDRNMEILDPQILERDSDSDGFSNLEEWTAKTEPIKKDSHPPYTDKLFFAARPQVDLTLRFAVNSNPDFQVVVQTRRGSVTKIYRLGQSFPEGSQKFTLTKFTDKKDAIKDISELEVRDNENKKLITLVLREVVPCPIFYVDFEFLLGQTPAEQKFRVQEGTSFHLSLDPQTEFTLVSAEPDSATIRKAGASDVLVIRKNPGTALAAPGTAPAAPGTAPAAPGTAPAAPGTAPAAPGTAPAAPGTAPAAPAAPGTAPAAPAAPAVAPR